MNEYLTKMFGDNEGYVYMAYKGKDESWQERCFAWPSDRRKLTGWVRVHRDANLFIVPALRGSEGRRKGDGINLRWLWADVDWEKVPSSKRDVVEKRINQIGTYIVRSGTRSSDGRYNVHVYVRLGEDVEVGHHYSLNTGLRDYLYADNKQADNSFLRLPGTTNWKTSRGAGVVSVGGHGKSFKPSAFTKLESFQKAIKTSATSNWSKVSLAGVPARAKRLVKMQTDEAVGRYGSRHKAVWAVVGDLHRMGLTEDQIHTAMDEFGPAEEKRQDEHGAYDVHKDISRRLAGLRHAQAIVDGTDNHSHDANDDSPFEELTDEEILAMGPDNEMVRKILARRDALREADQWEAQRRFMAPPDDVSWAAADALKNPPVPVPHLVAGIAGVKHNVVITAQYKTGKTAFTVASLAKALCDGEPFLGQLEVPTEGRVVGHWNCEMEGTELLDDYIRPAGFGKPERLHVANLRGYAVNILTPLGKAWAVNWLKSRNVQVWTIDSLARLLRMAGVKEKENDEVLNVLMAIDEIKVEAGVDVCFVITHTGRAEQEEGRERARGATVIDDWADARWIMTRDGDVRFLAVEGRGVRLATTSLVFDPETRGSVLGTDDKTSAREMQGVQAVLTAVTAVPGMTKTALLSRVREITHCGATSARELIEEAIECGFVMRRSSPNPKGGRSIQKHYPAQGASDALGVDNTGANRKNNAKQNGSGATARIVDMRRT